MALPTGFNTSVTLGGVTFNLDMVPVYLKKKLLSVIEKRVVFQELADKEDLPQGQGKTVRFLRYERVGLPLTPLSEGESPTDYRQLTVSAIEAVVEQWGDVMGFTDVQDWTVFHRALSIGQERMGVQAAELVDREIQRTLQSGTQLVFPRTAITSRAGILETDVVTTDVFRRTIASMRYAGVPDFAGDFIGVCDPYVEQDLTKDNTYITAATQQNLPPLFGGKVSPNRWMGIRWMVSNHMPIITLDTNADPNTVSSPAASGGETAIATTVDIVMAAAVDSQGFETNLSQDVAVGAFVAGADVVLLTLPTLPTGMTGYNLYAGPTGAATLQARGLAAGVYTLSGNGAAASGTGITYTTTGLLAPVQPASGVSVHTSYVFGKEAFANLKLTNLQTTLTPPVASDSDPLIQRRKAGWKVMFKPLIKNNSFFRRIESASNYD